MLKFAVMTTSSSLFNLICQCFHDEAIECCRFLDDVALSRAIYREDYHAILVDAATGIDATRAVFARRACYGDRRAPLIVIGAFADRDSIERAFEIGADDVVLSPIDRGELEARTYQALRRFQSPTPVQSEDWVELGPYRLDRRTGTVLVDDQEIRLTVREFAIAWLLFSRAGEYVSRRQIAGAIWSSTEDIVGRTLEQHIYKLRKKLALNGASGVQLRTMYAHGYRVELCDGRAESDASAADLTRTTQATQSTRTPQSTRATRTADAIVAITQAVDSAREEIADDCATETTRPVRTLDIHAKDSETARNAQPWGQYAAMWHSGTTHVVHRLAGFTAAGAEASDGDASVALTSFSIPAALLGGNARRR
ncbi:response regulator transcription factor [Paraburkholderia bryophila]|uniref:DNA-binding response OmpR family regulator n=1 Tax=Paraburkholderia bryophila TaxID=420952 RepID=A0A7Z0AXR1_9BURK|nr:response regulator transcription factor [Paraburkholderia bryophila]NYH12948.1 DNA-binding response OmpR family regulator [Paraburkholderia bryophila]